MGFQRGAGGVVCPCQQQKNNRRTKPREKTTGKTLQIRTTWLLVAYHIYYPSFRGVWVGCGPASLKRAIPTKAAGCGYGARRWAPARRLPPLEKKGPRVPRFPGSVFLNPLTRFSARSLVRKPPRRWTRRPAAGWELTAARRPSRPDTAGFLPIFSDFFDWIVVASVTEIGQKKPR